MIHYRNTYFNSYISRELNKKLQNWEAESLIGGVYVRNKRNGFRFFVNTYTNHVTIYFNDAEVFSFYLDEYFKKHNYDYVTALERIARLLE
jgi:hypothetical protein